MSRYGPTTSMRPPTLVLCAVLLCLEHHPGTARQSGVRLLVQSPAPLSARSCFKSIAPLVTACKEAAGTPGITLPEALPTAPDRAWRTWHFAFHSLPDLPEMLIAGREREYLDWFLRRKTANPETFSDADIAEYLRVFVKDGGLRAGLAYYRAAALSGQQNRELSATGKLKMPVLALGSDQGSIADMATPLKNFAEDVHGGVIANCGHFLAEEQPAAVAEELNAFLGESPHD
jgi:pimeloyl-ACP methyl ester carboxylesterase